MHQCRIDFEKTVAIFGLGDLGIRLALIFAAVRPKKVRLVLAGRNPVQGREMAALVATCLGRPVDFCSVDGSSITSIRGLLKSVRPDIVVQAASLVSPWAAFGNAHPLLDEFRAAGFAVNLAAQLPIISNLMRAVEVEKTDCVTINCSYPDVTNPVLKRIGKPPDIGIGNVGMIRRLIQLNYPEQVDEIRVFAHHSQVWPFLKGENGVTVLPVKVYFGQVDVSERLACKAYDIPITKDLNALAASHAFEVLLGYVDNSSETMTSAPGVLGLPGGWPIRITNSKASLDMPSGVSLEEMTCYQNDAGKFEGIEEIAIDGTVFFTEKLQRTLPSYFKVLGKPLKPVQALERAEQLKKLVGLVSW